MKYFFSTLLIFFIAFAGIAQRYPFSEGFQSTLSGNIPIGWSGDIPVLNYHGINDEKGLAALLHSGDKEDSIVSPPIGPIQNQSVLVFYYRWVMDFIYPSDPRLPNNKDRLEVSLSTNGSDFNVIYSIDSATHRPNLNFKRIEIPLRSFAGNTIQVKFKCIWGGGKYFQDIDSVQVFDGISAYHEMDETEDFLIYPNPTHDKVVISGKLNSATPYELMDCHGRLLENGTFTANKTLSLSEWKSGIYLLRIHRNIKKIVVVNN
jgi:hypothetical protein